MPRSTMLRAGYRVAGLGVRAPDLGRNDGLDILLRQPCAQGVAVIRPGPRSDRIGGAFVQMATRARIWVLS